MIISKKIKIALILMLAFSMFLVWSFSGCKAESAVEEVTGEAEEETTEEEAAAGGEDLASRAATEYTQAEANGETITIELWDWQNTENYATAFDSIFSLYKEKFPERNIGFKREALAYDSYTQQMKAAVTGGEAPPLYEAYPGPEVVELAEGGRLISLDEYINNDEEWKSWLGESYNYHEIRSSDGKIYLSPVDIFVEVIFYYKDMLEEAGISDVPETVDDLIAMVEPLKAIGKNVLATGLADDWQIYEPFYHLVHQQQPEGVDMVNQAMNGEISWQQDVFLNAINAYKRIYDAGVWREDEMSLNYNIDAIGNFTAKEAWGFWEAGDWYVGSMNEEDLTNDNIGLIPFPLVNESAFPAYGSGTGLGYVVNIETSYPNIMVEFLKLVSSPECASIFVENIIHPAAGFDSVPEGIEVPALFEACLDAGVDPNVRKSSPYYFNADAQKQISDGIKEVMLGLATAEDVVKLLDDITYNQ